MTHNLTEADRLWDEAWDALKRKDLAGFDKHMREFWKLNKSDRRKVA